MAWPRPPGQRRWPASLVLIALGHAGVAPRGLQAAPACPENYVQREPIALGCTGGRLRRIKFELSEAGTPHHILLWQAPKGTKNLRMTALISPPKGMEGRASLKVACTGGGKVLIGSDGGVLNREKQHSVIGNAHWQWGRDSESGFGEQFEEWFRVNGTLPCDTEVSLSNDHTSPLHGEIEYEWLNIDPCPAVPLGCKPCPQEECSDIGKIAVCDGSAFVRCVTKEAVVAKEDDMKGGCCFIYGEDEDGSAFLHTKAGSDRNECLENPAPNKGWNAECPKDAEEAVSMNAAAAEEVRHPTEPAGVPADLGRTADVLHPSTPSPAIVSTTAAEALEPGTSLRVQLTYELAGAFAMEVRTSVNVSTQAFHEIVKTALAEALGVHVTAFERFKVVALGSAPTAAARRLDMLPASGSPSAYTVAQVREAEEATSSVILGVGYEVAAGSLERQSEIRARLQNMDNPGSRVKVTLADLLARQDVILLATQVSYPPAPVSENGLLAGSPPASTSLRGGLHAPSPPPMTELITTAAATYTKAPSISTGAPSERKAEPTLLPGVPKSWIKKIRENKPAWASTAGAVGIGVAALCGVLAILCFCLCLCCNHCRSKPDRSAGKRPASERGNRVQATAADPRRDGVERTAEKKNPSGAGRLGYPSGYEPVRSDESSFHSGDRLLSVASDGSQAAGLRLLGNDGM